MLTGKITLIVMTAALQFNNAFENTATDLNGKLTPTQQAMNNFNKAIDSASVDGATMLIEKIDHYDFLSADAGLLTPEEMSIQGSPQNC